VNELLASQQRASELTLELNNIYASNGWAFTQKLLAVRRWFIPEHSRRERLLRLGIDSVRHFNMERLKSLPGEWMAALRKPAPAPAEAAQQPISYAALPSITLEGTDWFGNRTAWPLISVILPVYNHADMLESSARSVLQNSYPNLELHGCHRTGAREAGSQPAPARGAPAQPETAEGAHPRPPVRTGGFHHLDLGG
jgi:hypothetical protein